MTSLFDEASRIEHINLSAIRVVESLWDMKITVFPSVLWSMDWFSLYSASGSSALDGSSFFTALNDGLTSAIISFVRTLVFQVAAVLILPLLLGVDGIWLSCVAAEVMAMALVTFFIFAKREKYGYL